MKIKRFNDFLNEKYIETPEHRIKKFFDELTKNIKNWFSEGTFATNGSELADIQTSTLVDVDKYLMFDFNDNEYYYQVIIIISLEGVEEETLDTCHIKVKKYDNDGELIRTLGEDVDVVDLNEDKIIELFSKLDEESESLLDETPGTLSDEDSELEDTSIA
jgi:hypothetical protein